MYTIGQFSRIGRVSAKTLRYYDEIDLLKPAYVDRDSQYRYYSDEQIYEVLMISELKDYGLRLEEIKTIKERNDIFVLKNFLKNKVNEIDQEVQKNMALRILILEKLKKIEFGGGIMELNKDLKVEIKDREALTVVSKKAITSMNNIMIITGKVFEEISKMNLQPTGPVMTVYYDKEFDADNTEFEVCVPVNEAVIPEKYEYVRKFEGGLHACVTFVGPYSRLGEAYAKITKWTEDNKYQIINAPFEIYLAGSESKKNQNEYITEVCFPISK